MLGVNVWVKDEATELAIYNSNVIYIVDQQYSCYALAYDLTWCLEMCNVGMYHFVQDFTKVLLLLFEIKLSYDCA